MKIKKKPTINNAIPPTIKMIGVAVLPPELSDGVGVSVNPPAVTNGRLVVLVAAPVATGTEVGVWLGVSDASGASVTVCAPVVATGVEVEVEVDTGAFVGAGAIGVKVAPTAGDGGIGVSVGTLGGLGVLVGWEPIGVRVGTVCPLKD